MTRSTKSAQGRIFSAASLFKSCVRYGTGDFSNLLVLAWTGLYWGLSALVFTFVFTSCFENHLECSGCFVALGAYFSGYFSGSACMYERTPMDGGADLYFIL